MWTLFRWGAGAYVCTGFDDYEPLVGHQSPDFWNAASHGAEEYEPGDLEEN